MAGDTANPRIWLGADVYDAPVGTTAPTDVATAWGATWKALGLMSEDGASMSREDDETDHYAWGGILVRTTRSKHKRTLTIAAFEDNPTVWALVNPGSTALTATGITTRTVKVPSSNPRALGLELRDGTIIKRRIIPRCEVISVGDEAMSDSEISAFELTVNIYPSSAGVLFLDVTNDPQAVVI